MATFDGSSIFGAACSMVTANEPRGVQNNVFFGLDGVEALDGGQRGRVTVARGLLYGSTPADCATSVEDFRSYDDGQYYTLVDTAGTTWTDVRLLNFSPQDRAFAHSQLGFVRAYNAAFIHLT